MSPRVSIPGPNFGFLYREMRVDHLGPGELDYEFLLRNVVIADDRSRCKRRRRLKITLKVNEKVMNFVYTTIRIQK